MKKISIILFVILAVSLSAQEEKTIKVKGLKTFMDSVSYAVGQDLYAAWQQQGLEFNISKVAQAMQNAEKGDVAFTQEQLAILMQRFQADMAEKQKKKFEENVEAGAKYIAQVRNNKSVYATESGLAYICKKKGNGKHPTATDKVKVHYTGRLIDGTVFDSSVERGEPITFPLNAVIAGWTEGLQLMDEGSKYILYIPYNLGYGDRQVGSIPPGSTLVFEVELIEINPK